MAPLLFSDSSNLISDMKWSLLKTMRDFIFAHYFERKKNSLKILKGQPEVVNSWIDNVIAKIKGQNGNTDPYRTPNIEQFMVLQMAKPVLFRLLYLPYFHSKNRVRVVVVLKRLVLMTFCISFFL